MGDWNNLPEGEVVHYVDPLKQGECIAKSNNPMKSKFRNNPDFDDLPGNNGGGLHGESSDSDSDGGEVSSAGHDVLEDLIEREVMRRENPRAKSWHRTLG
eukprot:7795251-Karenia_brevis.AAC.1